LFALLVEELQLGEGKVSMIDRIRLAQKVAAVRNAEDEEDAARAARVLGLHIGALLAFADVARSCLVTCPEPMPAWALPLAWAMVDLNGLEVDADEEGVETD
jgi:hypothetical protein